MTDDGDTAYAFTEDVAKRLEACGWHTTEVKDGNNDIEGIAKAIEEARAMHDKPSLIKINTTIGMTTTCSIIESAFNSFKQVSDLSWKTIARCMVIHLQVGCC